MSAPTEPSKGRRATAAKSSRPRAVKAGDRPAAVHHNGDNYYRQEQEPDRLLSLTGGPEGKAQTILEGRLDVLDAVEVRDLAPDLTGGDFQDSVLTVRYIPPGGEAASRRALISGRDLGQPRNPEWPHMLGTEGRTARGQRSVVADAIRAMVLTIELREALPMAYASTGILRRDGKDPVFLRPGQPALTADGKDPGIQCQLPAGLADLPGVAALSLDHPAEGDDLRAGLVALTQLLNVVPDQRGIGAALLGQLAWAPVANWPGAGTVAVVLAGSSGKRKTALAGVVIAAQSSSHQGGPGVADPVTVKMRHGASSIPGMNRTLYPLGGMVGVVDDWFAGKGTTKQHAQQWEHLSLLADNSATGSGGSKATREGLGVRADRYPRCCVLATAEELPNEYEHGSEVARYVALRIRGNVNTDVLSVLQESARLLSGAHSAHVRRLLGTLTPVESGPMRALAWATEEVARWKVAGHNRARQGYVKVLAGAYLFAGTLRTAGLDGDGFLSDVSEALAVEADDQARRCGMTDGNQDARDPIRLWAKHFRALLQGGPGAIYLADAASTPGGSATPPASPDHSPAAFGWDQTAVGDSVDGPRVSWRPRNGAPLGAVHVDVGNGPAQRFPIMATIKLPRFADLYEQIVRQVEKYDEWSMPAVGDFRKALADAGYLASASPTGERHFGNVKARALVLDLGRILGDEQLDDEPPAGGPEEPSTPVGPVSGPVVAGDTSGALVDAEGAQMPCVACGVPTAVRVEGEPRHGGPACAPGATQAVDEPAARTVDDELAPAEPVSSSGPTPAKQSPATASAGEVGPSVSEQAERLREALTMRDGSLLFPEATPEDYREAVNIWHRSTDGLRIERSGGAAGVLAYERDVARHSGSKRMERLSEQGQELFSGFIDAGIGMARVTNHADPSAAPRVGQWVTGLDVNSQYLAAAASTWIGDGDPFLIDAPAPEQLERMRSKAGYIVLGEAWKTGVPAFGDLAAGTIVPFPALTFLTRDVGLTMPTATQALTWQYGGKRLDQWASTLRRVNVELADAHDLPSRMARKYGKLVTRGFLGGMLRSAPFNRTGTMRPDAADMLMSTANSNMLRALRKMTQISGTPVIGTLADTAWVAGDSGPFLPDGLGYSSQPGKWKAEKWAPVTEEMASAVAAGQHGYFRNLFNAADKARKAAGE